MNNNTFSRFDLEKYVDTKVAINLIGILNIHSPTVGNKSSYRIVNTKYGGSTERLTTVNLYPLIYSISVIEKLLTKTKYTKIARSKWLILLDILNKIKGV